MAHLRAALVTPLSGPLSLYGRAGATALDTIPTVVGAACGVAVLRVLTRWFWPDSGEDEASPDDDPDAGRRRLIVIGLLGLGVVSGVAGAVITRLSCPSR